MHARGLGLLAVVATAALVAGACTGDGDIEVLVDDGTDPSVLLGEAIDLTDGLSGRFAESVVLDFSDVDWLDDEVGSELDSPPDRLELSIEGEFDGEDVRATMTVDEDGELSEHEWRVVDGRAYRSVDPEMDHEIMDSIDARTWVEERLEEPFEGDEALAFMGLVADGRPSDPTRLLSLIERSADEVVTLEAAEIDGRPHRRLGARIGGREESWLPEAGLDEETRARADRIAAYGQHRLGADVEVWVDDAGLVRRLVLDSVDEVEPQYRECFLLMSFGGWSSTAEFSDLGARVDIVAPDPSDTVSLDEHDALMGMAGWDGEGAPPLPEWRPGDDEPTREWTATDREFLEEQLATYAPVLDIDPATVPELSIDELIALEDQLWSARAALPTYDTPLGQHDEHSLRSMVRMGMEWENVDPALADDLTPEQLVDLMEGYLSNPDSALGPAGGFGADEMFEGCPA